MTKEELQSKVDALKWYHAIPLPHGITTPGIFPINPDFYKLPEDLTGKRVLDVGAWDGYWTFECLKRGAKQVVAIDNFSDSIYEGERRSWEQFNLCAEALGYEWSLLHGNDRRVVHLDVDLLALPTPGYPFDVVLLYGVIYHCRHPMLMLDKLRVMTGSGGLLLVESHISDDISPYGEPLGERCAMEFYPGTQLAGCATNWWGPTLKCLANMVEAAGFKDVKAWKIADPGELSYARGFVQAVAA